MIKRRISLMLVLTMLLTLMIPTFAFGATTDYSGHWAEKTIQEWFDNDMLQGYEDGSFKPDAQITRAEFMTVVNNAFEFTDKIDLDFNDIDSDDWFYEEVQKAVKAGYIVGYEDNTARPEKKITRQEAAIIIARIKELSNNAAGANVFNDVNEIASWAKGGVGAVANEKYMIGYEDHTFRPLKFISRAEAVVTIDRALDKAVETPPVTGGGSGGGSGSVTTEAAILVSFTIADSTTSTAISTPSAITTESAIFTTTSSAITITAITTDGAEINVVVTSPSDLVVTSSAIKDGVISVNLDEIGEYTIELTVSKTDTSRKDYIDTKYTFIVKRLSE